MRLVNRIGANRFNWVKGIVQTLGLTFILSGSLSAEVDSLAEFKPELSEEFKVLLQDTTPEQGEMIFMRKCSSCHDHEQSGGHGKGPHLWNLLGRKAGSMPGFDYSEAMSTSGHNWSLANLNYYLTNTKRAVPGRIMIFRGIKKDKTRARLLAFLNSLHDKPQTLP